MNGQKIKLITKSIQKLKLAGKENGLETHFYLRSYMCLSPALDCLMNPGSPAPDLL